jgi:pimeloyl-ACP methyl ester carboxylesterase
MVRRLFLKRLAAVPFLPALATVPSTRSIANATTAPGVIDTPMVNANGVNLCYEETGEGAPLVWVHEFGGDRRSWEPQVRCFSRLYRVITYNQRGYAPSTIPSAPGDYSQDLLVEDLREVLKHLGVGPVHLGGCSMGANVARDFAIAHPDMTRSLIMLGAGAGSVNRKQFLEDEEAIAAGLERDGIRSLVRHFETAPNRASFKRKDPRGFAEFLRYVAEHDARACAHLAREVLMKRKTVPQLEAELKALRVPTLIMVGDQDIPSIEPSVMMREWIPHAGLLVLPRCGHIANLEEPALFNSQVAKFLAAVEAGRWAGWSA